MNKAAFSITLLAVFLLACHSTPQVENIFSQAQSLMENRPDSALTLLRSIPADELRGRALKARHALLCSQALDRNFIDLESDSVIAPAVSYYARRGGDRERAYTNYYLGCIRHNAKQIEQAVRVMVLAESYALKTDDSYLLPRIYSCLGRMYQDQHSFVEATTMFDKAERIFAADGDSVNLGYVVMNRAITYSLTKRPQDAIDGFRRAQKLFESLGDSNMACVMTRAIVNELKKDERVPVDSLKRLLRRAYAAATGGVIPETDYSMWASLHAREGDLDSTRHYLGPELIGREENPNVRCGMLLLRCKLEEQAGNYREAVAYWHRYFAQFDSIVRNMKAELVQEAEKRYRNQELSYANNLLRLRNRYINIGWGIAVLLGIGVLGLIWVRTIRRYKQFIGTLSDNYETFRERYEQLAKEMGNGSEEESGLIKTLEIKLKGFQELLDIAYNPRKPHNFIDDFMEYVKTISKDETAFADLQYVVNKRCYGLVDHLHAHHPELTDYELDMLCMLQFGFSFNCIRLLHHHNNIYSLYSRRSKIHRKLELPPHYRLEDYLKETVEQLRKRHSTPENPLED